MKKLFLMSQALIFTMAFALAGGVFADSPCKGLDESSCKGNDVCTWVNGKKVKSYCRAKPGHGEDGGSKKHGKKHEKAEKAEAASSASDAVKTDDKKTETKAEKKARKAKEKAEKKAKKDAEKAEKKAKKQKKNKKDDK